MAMMTEYLHTGVNVLSTNALKVQNIVSYINHYHYICYQLFSNVNACSEDDSGAKILF